MDIEAAKLLQVGDTVSRYNTKERWTIIKIEPEPKEHSNNEPLRKLWFRIRNVNNASVEHIVPFHELRIYSTS
jgi:hypothetical protein